MNEFRRKTLERMLKKTAGLLTDKVGNYIKKQEGGLKFKTINLSVPGGYVIWPGPSAIKPDGSVNIFFQIRGGSPALFNRSQTNAIVVILEAGGMGSSENTKAYGRADFFNRAISSIIAQLKKKTGRDDIKLGKWGAASWSGGYEAIHRALQQDQGSPDGAFIKKPDYIGIFDGMHHGPPGKPNEKSMEVYKRLAEEAKKGKTTFVVTHTAVRPDTYASSTDTAKWLVENTGLQYQPVSDWNGYGKTPENMAAEGNFYVFQTYTDPQPYMSKDPITGKVKPNVPGTAGYQHIRAQQDAGDYLPIWN